MKVKLPEKIAMGVCYYPEHWDESLWEDDLKRMLETGIETIRIAEFAWNKFEKEEGIFTFDFFDRFMRVVEKTAMKVIFCTPTATPPAWASHNYPEILNVSRDGVRYQHGHRRHYNYNSPKYRQLCSCITEKIAEHYGKHSSISGWQIDNELNCEIDEFYSESDTHAFRIFLRQKYDSLEALNQAWGTVFWNQDYTSWEQVFVPRTVITKEGNPHQKLDYLRFVSESAISFTRLQSEIIRKYIPDNVYITTNGLFGNMDNHKLINENLDLLMYDSYPNFAYCLGEDPKHSKDLNDRKWSKNLMETRSISPIFGVIEQQSGPNGWTFRMEAPAPKPGQMALWSMQSVAHGADFISYFRWRTCTVGTEIYWHGILDYDNRDNRRIREIADLHKKFEAIREVSGAEYKASFAVIKEYDNVWDTDYDAWHGRVHKTSESGWFQAAQLTHTPMDYLYIHPDTTIDCLKKYPVLVYPHAAILKEHTAKLLSNYVEQGGKLVIGCRTGYKNEFGHCVMTPKPGLLSDLCGADVVDFTFIGPADDEVYAAWDNVKLETAVFNDVIVPLPGAEILAAYDSNYYEGQVALVRNQVGKGEAYYFGAAFSEQAARVFLKKLGISSPYSKLISLPEMCELAIREKDGQQYLFILNFSHDAVEIELNKEMQDMFTGVKATGKIELAAYETKVYKI